MPLDLEDAPDGRIDVRLSEASFTHAGDNRVDGGGHVAGHEQDVGAGGDREFARFGDTDALLIVP